MKKQRSGFPTFVKLWYFVRVFNNWWRPVSGRHRQWAVFQQYINHCPEIGRWSFNANREDYAPADRAVLRVKWYRNNTEMIPLRWTKRSPCRRIKIGRKTAGAGHLRNRQIWVENRGFFALYAVKNCNVMILPYDRVECALNHVFSRFAPGK